MRLQVISDIHIEFHKDNGRSILDLLDPTGIDALMLAGDIGRLSDLNHFENFLKGLSDKYEKVFFVPGNHEYYKCVVYQAEIRLDELLARLPRITRLRTGQAVEYKEHRFLGDTMWFPDHIDNNHYADLMSDFDLIKKFVPWVYRQNGTFRNFLKSDLRPGDVVMTHYLPAPDSISPRFRNPPNSALNRFFLSDVSHEIWEKKPALWIHGHTHDACDYKMGPTRVVCNPLGYPREIRPYFAPMTIDI